MCPQNRLSTTASYSEQSSKLRKWYKKERHALEFEKLRKDVEPRKEKKQSIKFQKWTLILEKFKSKYHSWKGKKWKQNPNQLKTIWNCMCVWYNQYTNSVELQLLQMLVKIMKLKRGKKTFWIWDRKIEWPIKERKLLFVKLLTTEYYARRK